MKTYQPFEIGSKSKKKRIKVAKLLLEAFEKMWLKMKYGFMKGDFIRLGGVLVTVCDTCGKILRNRYKDTSQGHNCSGCIRWMSHNDTKAKRIFGWFNMKLSEYISSNKHIRSGSDSKFTVLKGQKFRDAWDKEFNLKPL